MKPDKCHGCIYLTCLHRTYYCTYAKTHNNSMKWGRAISIKRIKRCTRKEKEDNMREIKFRGKSVETNKWVYGDLLTIGRATLIYHGPKCGCEVVNDDKIAVGLYHDEVSVVCSDTVGQFTGLKDSDGVDVYDGDVIKSTHRYIYHVIGYNESRGAFTATLIDKYMNDDCGLKTECNVEQHWLCDTKKVVIGNIHDSPELLKGGEK